ncbi:MAG: hypothetical protein NC200_06355 [Candidatus Gastranaerophilales bacterium]|nr:hypothetical protein [Candidatus Gastranaerophilales bacterium]
MNKNRVRNNNIQRQRAGYISDTVRRNENEQVISGYFPKESSVKAMAIKKVNNTLCGLLLCAIFISAISYYFVVSSEIKLNEYSRETTLLNVENAELQNKLDRLKSFNNVDLTMQKNNLLQKPEKVIEATEVKSNSVSEKTKNKSNIKPTAWSIGY